MCHPFVSSLFLQLKLPFVVELVEFLLAIPRTIQFAADEPNHKVTRFVHDFLTTPTWHINVVGVEKFLRNKGKFR